MAGVLVSRSADTVRTDFKQFVNQWIETGNLDHISYTQEEMQLLASIGIKLQEPDEMLTREEAILVSRELSEMALNDMRKTISRPNNVLSDVDCMSLYSDIYYMYLRPGTYSI